MRSARSRGSRRTRSCTVRACFSTTISSAFESLRSLPSCHQPLVDRAEPALEGGEDGGAERDRLAVHRAAGGYDEVGVPDQALRVDRALGHDEAARRCDLLALLARARQDDGLRAGRAGGRAPA